MKDEKKIKELAEKIFELEKQCQLDEDSAETISEIDHLIFENNLSMEDLLEIDTYIQEKFLTK